MRYGFVANRLVSATNALPNAKVIFSVSIAKKKITELSQKLLTDFLPIIKTGETVYMDIMGG
jgi:hypothetical protein